MLLAPSTSPPNLSGNVSAASSSKHPTFDLTKSLRMDLEPISKDNGNSSVHSNDGVAVGANDLSSSLSLSLSISESPSPAVMKKKSVKLNNRGFPSPTRGGSVPPMLDDDQKRRGIAVRDLMDDDADSSTIRVHIHTTGKSSIAPDQNIAHYNVFEDSITTASQRIPIVSKSGKPPSSTNTTPARLRIALPETTIVPPASTGGTPYLVPSPNVDTLSLLTKKENAADSVAWISSVGTFAGRNAEDCLHMVYRTLYLQKQITPSMVSLSTSLSTVKQTEGGQKAPKIERLGGYMFLMQESVLMFINTLGDAAGGGLISSKPSSASLAQLATLPTASSRVNLATASSKMLDPASLYISEFDDDGAVFSFYFPSSDIDRILGVNSPFLNKRASSKTSTASATTTASGTVDKRIFHLFIRERRKPYLYCGTCYPIAMNSPAEETLSPSGSSHNSTSNRSTTDSDTFARVKFRLLYFRDGPQPLSLHEDYQRILLEHTSELDKRRMMLSTDNNNNLLFSNKGMSNRSVVENAMTVESPLFANLQEENSTLFSPMITHRHHVSTSNSQLASPVVPSNEGNRKHHHHNHVHVTILDTPPERAPTPPPSITHPIKTLQLSSDSKKPQSVHGENSIEEEEEMLMGDWSHSVRLSRNNSMNSKPHDK